MTTATLQKRRADYPSGKLIKEMSWLDGSIIVDNFVDHVNYYFDWVEDCQDGRSRYLFKGWIPRQYGDDDQIVMDFLADVGAAANQGKKTERYMNSLSLSYEHMVSDKIAQLTNGAYEQYLALATFSFPTTRKSSTIREYQAAFSELDYYKIEIDSVKLSKQEVMRRIESLIKSGEIPKPTAILHTRGISLIYLHTPVPFYRMVEYRQLQVYLNQKLKPFGADAKDAVRYLRAAGSKHSKTNQTVYLEVFTVDRYDFDDLYRTFVKPTVRPKPHKKKIYRQTGKKILPMWQHSPWGSPEQLRSLHYTRLKDLEKWAIELRGGRIKGHREFCCFLYRYWHLCTYGDEKQAIQAMLDFYDQLQRIPGDEYTHQDLVIRTQSAEIAWNEWLEDHKKGYNYKTVSIVQELEITLEEQRQLNTFHSEEESTRRNTESKRLKRGSVTREEYRQQKNEQTENMLWLLQKALESKPHAKVGELAMALRVSVSTIHRLKRQLNK